MTTALAIALCLAAVGPPETLSLHPSVDNTPPGPSAIPLTSDWRAHLGECAGLEANDFDDKDWPTFDLLGIVRGMELGGTLCLSRRFDVPADLDGVDLTLLTIHFGSFEAYLDGALVQRVGQVPTPSGEASPVDLRFGSTKAIKLDRGAHRLALKVWTEPSTRLRRMGFRTPILSVLETAESEAHRLQRASRAGRWPSAFTAVAWTLAILHLFLFLYRRDSTPNLYFAVLATAAGGITAMDAVMPQASTVDQMLLLSTIFAASLLLFSLMSIRFYYSIFEERLPRIFWAFLLAGIAAAIAVRWMGIRVVFAYALLSSLEQTRVIILAAIRRRPNAYIVCIGGGLLVVAGFAQIVPHLSRGSATWPEIYLVGFAGLFISIAVYLAKTYSDTHRNLAMRDVELKEAAKREAVLKELEATNEHLRDTQAELVRTAKMASLGELVAGIAHEINTPIGAIHSIHQSLALATDRLVEILARHPEVGAGEPQLAKALSVLDDAKKVIGSGSSRVAEIVRRLKSFARLDEAELQKTSVEEGLDDTLVIVHHQLKNGIKVEKKYGGVPEITCYPSQLNQVFLNLMVNAIQALGAEGTLTLTTMLVDKEILIQVADDGPGIPKDQLARIFDPGFTTKGVKVGTGLGLSISEQIVREHKGRLTVESEPGKGACFSIYLPTDLEEILARARDQEVPPPVDRA